MYFRTLNGLVPSKQTRAAVSSLVEAPCGSMPWNKALCPLSPLPVSGLGEAEALILPSLVEEPSTPLPWWVEFSELFPLLAAEFREGKIQFEPSPVKDASSSFDSYFDWEGLPAPISPFPLFSPDKRLLPIGPPVEWPSSEFGTIRVPAGLPQGGKVSSSGTFFAGSPRQQTARIRALATPNTNAPESDGAQFPIYNCAAILATRSQDFESAGGRAWSKAENIACVKSIIEDVNANALRRRARGLGHDEVSREQMWANASRHLARLNFMRSPAAVKNQWNRELRSRSGVDERESNRGGGMATSQQPRRIGSTTTSSPAKGAGVSKRKAPPLPPAASVSAGPSQKRRRRVLVEPGSENEDEVVASPSSGGWKRKAEDIEGEEVVGVPVPGDSDETLARRLHQELNRHGSSKRRCRR